MQLMVVTLDVSKLSGWLNASAPCRVEREPCGEEGRHAGPGDGRGVGLAAAQAACAGRNPTAEVLLAGARAERT